mgnify:FL=1
MERGERDVTLPFLSLALAFRRLQLGTLAFKVGDDACVEVRCADCSRAGLNRSSIALALMPASMSA